MTLQIEHFPATAEDYFAKSRAKRAAKRPKWTTRDGRQFDSYEAYIRHLFCPNFSA